MLIMPNLMFLQISPWAKEFLDSRIHEAGLGAHGITPNQDGGCF